MRYQRLGFLARQLKHKIFGKPCPVALDGLIEPKRLDVVQPGEFGIEQAVTLEHLTEIVRQQQLAGDHEVQLESVAIHARRILTRLPAVTVADEGASLIAHGRALNLPEFSSAREVKVFYGPDRLVAIATRIAGTLFQPKVVLSGR